MARSKFLVAGVVATLLLSMAPQGLWGGGVGAAGNPFDGIKWVPNADVAVQQQPGFEIIAQQQYVEWIGGWFDDNTMAYFVEARMTVIEAAGGIPIFAVYNVPNRDCNGYSQGGASDGNEYRRWIGRFAAAIGLHKVILLLEPDGLVVTHCLSPGALSERYSLINQAVSVFKRNPNASVYIDGGNHTIRTVPEIAATLNTANIATADGFFLNSTLYHYTSTEVAYGRAVSAAVGGKHFIVDTSRNGLGTWDAEPDAQPWCNGLGRALGIPPTTVTGEPLADAFIWLKPVWQSDGECGRGNPNAGQNFFPYAQGLVQRFYQPFSDMPGDPAAAEAVRALALRGIIRGNGDGTFGSNSPTLRAQMAALIARPLYWELESWGSTPFPDQCDPPGRYNARANCIDPELWANVGTLSHYNVAKGFSDGTYDPRGAVLYEQVILFISRAMVQGGYWRPQPDNPAYFPNLPSTTAREKSDRADLATYVFYTQNLGGVPDRPATGNFTAWDQPAPRAWFALALYRALKTAYL